MGEPAAETREGAPESPTPTDGSVHFEDVVPGSSATDSGFEVVDVDSLFDLVRVVLSKAQSLPDGRFLWFRGQCTCHPLLPKIMRENKTGDEALERELRLLTRFRQRSIAYWPRGYEQSDWEHLFAMQHYGLPTRLLDWSENAFVAAYFALSGAERRTSHDESCRPAIWCIDPVDWNRSIGPLSEFGDDTYVLTTNDQIADGYRPETDRRRYKTPVAMYGAHNSDRIVAQRGTFMVWGVEPSSLEHVAAMKRAGGLSRITCQGDGAELFADLRSLGFTETMVFPELPSLAQELTRAEGWR